MTTAQSEKPRVTSRKRSSRPKDSRAARREPLSRARILQTAVQLVDEEGLEALTMRRLGKELGVQGMSIYNHIPGKAALLYGLMETVLADMKPVYNEEAGWRERIRAGMRAFRAVGLAHPRVFALNTRPWPGANPQRSKEDLETLREAGFTSEQAHAAFHSLLSYVVGFVAWETAAILRDPNEIAEGIRSLPGGELPTRQELAALVASVNNHQEELFDFGLEAMLNGLEDLLAHRS
jgi:AcrR family transcriptional regulator